MMFTLRRLGESVPLDNVIATPLFAVNVFAPIEWFLNYVFGPGMDVLADLLGMPMLEYPYMQRAYLAALCIALIGPVVGTFLVHREMAMISDTLAHTAFAGVAVGLFLNSAFSLTLSPLFTAFVVAVVTALLVELLVEHAGAYSDTSLAIVLTGGFAVGSILITATDGGIAVGIDAYLFGSLATVSTESVGILVLMSVLVGSLVTLAYRPLLYVTFDATAARAARLNVRLYKRLMVVLTALVVVSAMQIMGVILVAAMLVVPVAAAAQVAESFKQSILLAILAAEFAAIAGVTLSYVYGIAAGGSIVVAAIAVYTLALSSRELRHRLPTVQRFSSSQSEHPGTELEADGGEQE
ncbi:metal ABC transporter permease [Halorubrum ezzemoulense]|jgi:zinc transport system permease protein|uniref:Metal ABC transporter permease n=1 Tax=Haloglomus irregulare TaxID=2234134 RepID=A0A554MUK1_9EURY|nr:MULTISPECIES: metal ABC transporter permease [Halobacteria]MDB2226088.1 metal ABC transporter permease [Halorubrum ezzemoulense]MDB2265572.1 metal ABC transporter permease [Halorubrum ezzemoulense]MDB9250564.1 metal ABC transporter permease [Halorubrum ezzemoulense]MDB9260679.1 metal ABC transporter permease [Halorubrum ezzemoulense]MDB9264068.1 metal ABC transporter permease [Halorubrum ezzemoulense]